MFKVGDRVVDLVHGSGKWFGKVLDTRQHLAKGPEILVLYDGDKDASWFPESDYALVEPDKEVRITDPTTGGQKGQKQEQYSMIPVDPLAEVARVYGYGAQKYDRDNWRKGYAWSLSIDALMRHIEQFRRGESMDTESGRQHLAHAAFHLFTLMEYDSKGLGTDDRGDLPQSVNRGGNGQR